MIDEDDDRPMRPDPSLENRKGFERDNAMGRNTNSVDRVVEQPAHYASGEIECIDAIKAALAPSTFTGFEAFCTGNVIKYVWRWKLKSGVQDLQKARRYLDWLISAAE